MKEYEFDIDINLAISRDLKNLEKTTMFLRKVTHK